jgi:hypothetical protein
LAIDIHRVEILNIIKTIERDVDFFKANGLMDYSLLIGIEKIKINPDDVSDSTTVVKKALNYSHNGSVADETDIEDSLRIQYKLANKKRSTTNK